MLSTIRAKTLCHSSSFCGIISVYISDHLLSGIIFGLEPIIWGVVQSNSMIFKSNNNQFVNSRPRLYEFQITAILYPGYGLYSALGVRPQVSPVALPGHSCSSQRIDNIIQQINHSDKSMISVNKTN